MTAARLLRPLLVGDRTGWGRVLEATLDVLYPRACRLCGAWAEDGFACDRHRWTETLAGARCGRCAARLAGALPDGYVCAACRRGSPAFADVTALGDYHGEQGLRHWLLALKHGGRRDLARPLGTLLGMRVSERLGRGAVLVPVPLHRLRRWDRGHDQALLLARAAAEAAGGRVERALRRRRWTAPQGGPGARSRAANVRDAFAVARPRGIVGRPVGLIDDVVTSGATAAACARVLRRAGSRSVHVFCVARVEEVRPAGQALPWGG